MTNESNESPDAIKTDIARTRQDMSSKIEQIQARLNPDNIKAQAQETVRDIVRESTDSVTTYLNAHSKEIGITVAQTIKRNPIPAALIGLGIGWLLVESYGGSDDNSSRSSKQRDAWYPESESRYTGATTSSGLYSERESGPVYGSQYAGSQTGNSGYAGSSSSDQSSWVGEKASGLRDQAAELREQAGDKVEQLRDTAQHLGEQVRDQLDQWGNRVQSKTSSASDQASYYANQARNQASNVSGQASQYADQALSQVAHVGEQASQYASQAREQASMSVSRPRLMYSRRGSSYNVALKTIH